jgi:lambda repressor-like predicted transcriptional regulator
VTGNDIRNRLKELEISLAGVARKMGISPQSLDSKLDAADPKMSFVMAVVNAAGITIAQLHGAGLETLSKEPETRYGADFQAKYIACLEEKAAALQRVVDLQSQLGKSEQSPVVSPTTH